MFGRQSKLFCSYQNENHSPRLLIPRSEMVLLSTQCKLNENKPMRLLLIYFSLAYSSRVKVVTIAGCMPHNVYTTAYIHSMW